VSEPNAVELVSRLEAQLTPEARHALQTLRRLTDEASIDLYVVGGAVRDLVLGRASVDLDLAVDADVEPIAKALAEALGGRSVIYERFGTATVTGSAFALDLVRTRRETYARPGALPDVAAGTIEDDLARRDFTINAMALRLSREPAIIDPNGGLHDIATRHLRVLYEASFQDDPTRMFRAMRYAARLHFNLETHSAQWLQRDLAYIDTLTGQRIRRELQLLFEEDTAPEAALLADRDGILRAVHPALGLAESLAQRWRAALDASYYYSPRDELGLLLIIDSYSQSNPAEISQRLALDGRFSRALRDFVRLWDETNGSTKLAAMRNNPVGVVELLDPLTPSVVWAASIITNGLASQTCLEYLSNWRHVSSQLRGDDVIALGVQPGVAVGDALRELRNAHLRGEATSRDDEEAVVRALLQKTDR
jgi:tRNA nucleotidyltransferase (CCA-adding enzyme)